MKQSVELAKKGIILISVPKKNAKRFQGSFKGILALMKHAWKYVIMYHMRARIEYFIGRVKKYERELGSYMLAILKQNLIALKDKKRYKVLELAGKYSGVKKLVEVAKKVLGK